MDSLRNLPVEGFQLWLREVNSCAAAASPETAELDSSACVRACAAADRASSVPSCSASARRSLRSTRQVRRRAFRPGGDTVLQMQRVRPADSSGIARARPVPIGAAPVSAGRIFLSKIRRISDSKATVQGLLSISALISRTKTWNAFIRSRETSRYFKISSKLRLTSSCFGSTEFTIEARGKRKGGGEGRTKRAQEGGGRVGGVGEDVRPSCPIPASYSVRFPGFIRLRARFSRVGVCDTIATSRSGDQVTRGGGEGRGGARRARFLEVRT